ncbi:serine protease [Streptomyces litchfieldiae]|uniref:Serine protease n=1 Tax=Streptomyces litchfieldiae TaxID=3075543 RepID=A0ABU2MTX9_9ACTN|nr:serine protease [Streptomyces sp. DSM 44938]MDT0344534.1 serine protease [Streptomyces sp. DSM 44938]
MITGERIRTEHERHLVAAGRRYRDSDPERATIERRRRDGAAFPDSGEAIAARATRLIERHGVPAAAAVASIHREPLVERAAFERIIGVSRQLQAWSFLPRGARAARTVGRLSMRERGRELPVGTGFLVSPSLLLTNHHVLPDEEAARQCFVEFDAQVTIDNTPGVATRLELDPDAFFTSHEPLDYALVPVRPGDDGRPPGETFGWNRLSAQLGKLVIDEPVNIVGHPMGRLKEIAVRHNALQVRLDDFLHYSTDTEPGSSGSPVFNDQWEVVALHHSGVPRTDPEGRVLRRDGAPWEPGDGENAIDWASNEGVRVSTILGHLATVSLDGGRGAFLAELGPESGLAPGAGPRPAGTAPPAPPAPPAADHAVLLGVTEARARRAALGGGRHLVFLHGRDQQEEEPEPLRRKWAAALNYGLTEAGLRPVDPADVWMPFYAKTLIDAMKPQERLPRPGERLTGEPARIFEPESPSTRRIYEELIDEAARRTGMPPAETVAVEGALWSGVVGRLQRQLSWLAARTDLDQWLIAAIFRDVAAYLDERRVREAVVEAVLRDMPDSGEVVLVAHSLGTVVAMDVISRLPPGLEVSLLVTAGSPLGMDSVHDRLFSGGPRRPERVGQWVNVWCPADAVTIGCPLADDWHGELTDLAVSNARERAHSIREYLSHRQAAEVIGRRPDH